MKEHIKAWDSEYERSIWRGHYSLERLDASLNTGLLLDAGCGSGKYSLPLRMRGFDVLAMDASQKALRLASKSSAIRGLDIGFMAANIYQIPLKDASFDIIWCYGVLQHLLIREREFAIHEFRRVLKDGGLLFLEVFGEEDMRYGGVEVEPNTFSRENGIVYHYFCRNELERLFVGWKIDILESRKKKQFKGRSYTRHLISVVAKKV
jgi:SAM-dependent methyltransferase